MKMDPKITFADEAMVDATKYPPECFSLPLRPSANGRRRRFRCHERFSSNLLDTLNADG